MECSSCGTINGVQERNECENFSEMPVVIHTLHHGSVLIEVFDVIYSNVIKSLGLAESGKEFFRLRRTMCTAENCWTVGPTKCVVKVRLSETRLIYDLNGLEVLPQV